MSVSKNQPATSAGVNQRLMSRTQDTSAAGKVDFNNLENAVDENTGAIRVKGGVGIAKDLFVKGLSILAELFVSKVLRLGVEINSTLTGADANLATYSAPIVVLTNALLASIAQIGLPVSGKMLILINRTGGIFIIKPGDVETPGAANFPVAPNSIVVLVHNPQNGKYHVMSGGGSGVPNGGLTGQVLRKLSGTDGDADWQNIPGMDISSLQTLTAGQAIAVAAVNEQRVRVRGSSGPTTVVLPNPTIDGQKLWIQGASNASPIVIAETGNIAQDGAEITLRDYSMVLYIGYPASNIWVKSGGNV